MFSRSVLLSIALAAHAAIAVPVSAGIEARDVIDHDAVVGFAETVPDTTVGSLMLTYKPLLKVTNGCVPFPAVDSAGNTGGGLAASGTSSSDCDSSTGQVYARAVAYQEYFAIMYSWYMPKDSPSDGLGHRHDWEQSVVWLTSSEADATLVGYSVSAHGGSSTSTSPGLSGTRPLTEYVSTWPINHALEQTTTVGGEQPLIAWDSLPTVAQDALSNTDFGSAIVPFKDATFTSNLEKAYAAF